MSPAAGMHTFAPNVNEAAYQVAYQYLNARLQEAQSTATDASVASYTKAVQRETMVLSADGRQVVVVGSSVPGTRSEVYWDSAVEESDLLCPQQQWDLQVRAHRRCPRRPSRGARPECGAA
eukprot:TRINITY_DN11832_c0_g1_i1.p2 TRINITY_DN11832_c0_g1~~TRINITY_DN11832_c0_g1_i1.p2  ORF type:complete len:121 (+),score=14.46 TRINITY_DN11832_c0_g1_i1:296-658(+)